MKDTRTAEQKRFDRKQEILGTITGIYARNHSMRQIPIDDKTLNEIADHIAPFYITLTQADYMEFKETVNAITKDKPIPKISILKKVLDKFKLFC